MLKLAGEFIEGQLADHIARLDAHTYNIFEKLAVNSYYSSLLAAGLYTDAGYTLTADTLYAVPFPVSRALTIDRLGARIKTAAAAGKKIRFGIYNDGANLDAGSLLLDAGEVAADSGGLKVITINQQLPRGLYWLACISDGTPDLYYSGSALSILGNATLIRYNNALKYVSQSYGSLPDPFPASPSEDYKLLILGVRIKSLD